MSAKPNVLNNVQQDSAEAPTNKSVFSSFCFPSGLAVKNRIVKAAMEENLATEEQTPSGALISLYRQWAEGGVGLILTGNVMVDHLAMTGPGGLALEQNSNIAAFAQLASVSKTNGCKVVMQINHPGRQVFSKMGGKVLSASNVPLDMGKHSHLFGQPKAMAETEIADVIQRFVQTALRAKEAGFDGVQIHAAHGYLLAQFLSPLTNKRQDKWGGSLENRARLLLNLATEIIQACGEQFSVSVKLNSADFQRGGFEPADAQMVVDMLSKLNIDFVELSGGSYEAPAMQGNTADERTLAREAYFLEFAQTISAHSSVPIMTTGGITRLPVAQQVVETGVTLVGMATALAFNPDLVYQWQQDSTASAVLPRVTWKDKTLSGLAVMAMVKRQMRRVGEGKNTPKRFSPVVSLIVDQIRAAKLTKRYRKRFRHELS
ncbi:NADH oxidase [Paraglaciecola mesophila]|uniref:NADH oxidase n=1 Tax=Paraglaciecola mesophila TaxID=197222 RepID=A0A857JPJ8_9ALTE|nr:NADH:flavin oxidoreductase/NADH oxidase family protein [Paraglaciecola mesophila]QHJ13989.1 NADH oxidase [Paraglaciecola mesophila]